MSILELPRRVGADLELRREAVTMGFYTFVTLFAALAAGDDFAVQQTGDLIVVIVISTLGLALAHWFAATIAIQLVRDAHAYHTTAEYLTAHLVLPLVAAISASIAVAIAPNDVKLLAGRLTAGALLGLLVASEARHGGSSPARSMRLALLAFACALGIAGLKRFLF